MPSSAPGQEPLVLVDFREGVARLTLNNPARKNAITPDMSCIIEQFCDRVESDETIGTAIVDARGGYFCSGADTRDLAVASSDPASSEALSRISAIYTSFTRFGLLPVPSVAVVTGGAVGAGINLALAADVLLVTPDAVLDSGFLARGIHPGGGHFSLLGRSLSRQQAIVMGALGITLSGEQAQRLGLAWLACHAETIGQCATDLVAIAARDPALARRIKKSADLELGPAAVPWAAAIEVERGVQMWSLSRKGEALWSTRSDR
jgi:enoyl-CoA hydratase